MKHLGYGLLVRFSHLLRHVNVTLALSPFKMGTINMYCSGRVLIQGIAILALTVQSLGDHSETLTNGL